LSVQRLARERERLSGYARTVQALHPVNTLKRGFTITRDESGRAIRHVSDVKNNTNITTELVDGTLTSEVKQARRKSR
jgi:exodeoxyribonuclease VII large subunit